MFVGNQAFAAAPGFSRQAAPEFVAGVVIHLVRLTAVTRLKLDALFAQPDSGVEAAANEDFAQVRVSLLLRDARHVIKVGVCRVGTVVVRFLFVFGQLGNDLCQLIHVIEHHAHQATSVATVAAAIVDGRCFQHDDICALFTRGECCAGGGVTRANDDNIGGSEIRETHNISFENN